MTATVNEAVRRRVEIQFLGAFSVTVDGVPVRRWRAGKARQLFQYLALHQDRILTRERLYEVLWPEAEWSAGRSSLKVAAHALRQVLQARPEQQESCGIRLVHRDFGYVLHMDDATNDVARFQRLVTAGLASARDGRGADAADALRGALALYRGEFLPGEQADWIIEQREYLKCLALRALAELRCQARAREDFPGLIELCRRTLEIDRHHEETYRELMAAHGSRGELVQVRNWYELCARRLREELGVPPARETQRLLGSLLQSPDHPARPAASAGPGMHRARRAYPAVHGPALASHTPHSSLAYR
ncbi:BTAD domain-containing putative transcriptional regulator [Streptomyces sp. NPDC001339]|uniref:AfsR/SARP family transcriptional regulator n=1 Tax=Streptomyces sp. NPDC001339 TaxID=3364563 RepID=UPI0036894C53